MYTRTTPTRIEYLATLWADGFDPSYAYRDGRSCGLALARADGNALDAFCRNSAFVVALRGEAEETRPQAADYIDWRPDRFNNHVPKFPSPSELLASPDGKHAYLFDEGTSAILHFERLAGRRRDARRRCGCAVLRFRWLSDAFRIRRRGRMKRNELSLDSAIEPVLWRPSTDVFTHCL